MSAEEFKDQGNQFFQQKNWAAAIKAYTKSVEVDPKCVIAIQWVRRRECGS